LAEVEVAALVLLQEHQQQKPLPTLSNAADSTTLTVLL
jgi:hypothetical protein